MTVRLDRTNARRARAGKRCLVQSYCHLDTWHEPGKRRLAAGPAVLCTSSPPSSTQCITEPCTIAPGILAAHGCKPVHMPSCGPRHLPNVWPRQPVPEGLLGLGPRQLRSRRAAHAAPLAARRTSPRRARASCPRAAPRQPARAPRTPRAAARRTSEPLIDTSPEATALQLVDA